jgi:2-polyprenyl-6-methoxyphenol hydroxylase-like FAD-dependent oxidoreductase/predicted FMN-binding regulatory protein PaiB
LKKADVLIVGAGPTGLTLACDLLRRNVAVRIIDKQEKFTTASRGKAGFQPRSQEVFDDLGVVDDVLAAGTQRMPFRHYRGSRLLCEKIPYVDNEPRPDAPYRRLLFIRQSRVEDVLRKRLATLGVEVEGNVALVGFTQNGDESVTAALSSPNSVEEIQVAYLVGADGGASLTRKTLGLPFEGYTDESRKLLVGDVEAEGLPPDAWYQWYDPQRGVVMMCPLPESSSWQIQVSPPRGEDGNVLGPTLEAFQLAVDSITQMPIKLANPTWMSTMRINVRMVDQMRVGRVFLAGDAAHVHPVTAALGANTGVQDAYNLGWKLALALKNPSCAAILDTYQEERVPIAAWTLKTACDAGDAIFEAMKAGTGGAEVGLTEESLQLGLNYRASSLSQHLVPGTNMRVHAGDRAPDSPCLDAKGQTVRLFDVFRGPHFSLLGFSSHSTDMRDLLATVDAMKWDGVKTFLSTRSPEAYGAPDDTLVLVRPDGYIGLVASVRDGQAVFDYLGAHAGLRPAPTHSRTGEPMYRPPYFRAPDLKTQHDLIEEYPLGLLTLSMHGRQAAVHVPFVLDREFFPYGRLRGHLSRGNPIAKALHDNVEVMVAFQGPSSYISPDNYASAPHFPTWAYAAVHVRARPIVYNDAQLVRQLTDLIAHHEKKLAPKQPWVLAKGDQELFDEYLQLIQGFELPIVKIDGIFKLGQNKSPRDMATQSKAFRERNTDASLRLAELIDRHNPMPKNS